MFENQKSLHDVDDNYFILPPLITNLESHGGGPPWLAPFYSNPDPRK